MSISQKCQYALRATFELAKRQGTGVTTISEIAAAQAIPGRFLEAILGQLKQAGFVESRRGVAGGYRLAVSANELTVGQIIKLIEGPMAPVKCIAGTSPDCPLHGHCAFIGLWSRAQEAVEQVYDGTTIQDLMDEERLGKQTYVASYCI